MMSAIPVRTVGAALCLFLVSNTVLASQGFASSKIEASMQRSQGVKAMLKGELTHSKGERQELAQMLTRQQEAISSDPGNAGSWGSGRERKRSTRSSIPGKIDIASRDASIMGGLHHESKVAALRMWLEGGDTGKGSSLSSQLSSIADNLPYALPIVAGCILVLVLIAVRILRKHQPQNTSYITQAFKGNIKGGLGRRY